MAVSRTPDRFTDPSKVEKWFARNCSSVLGRACTAEEKPRATWARLMATLGDHFGEDATLPPAERDAIAAYLERYAAEAWDTKAAHRFAAVGPENPISITAMPGWQRIHRHIDPGLFRSMAVKARSNCIACHRDVSRRKMRSI